MVDPQFITDFNRSDYDLEEFALFSVAVAGKTASQIAKATEKFIQMERRGETPFEKIRLMKRNHALTMNIQSARLGKWSLLSACYDKMAHSGIDLRTCSLEELEELPGIGPKTSRFFVMHSRPNQKIAALDTHILSYLRDQGFDTPKNSPSGRRYAEIERMFIEHAESIGRGDDLAEFDLEIWNAYSTRSGLGATGEIKVG
tara:strand:+ start:74189 stop:74791 length:603 start_codon:yes stop_codon:yes gene_type:complete